MAVNVARLMIKKREIDGKVQDWTGRIFTVQPVAASEQLVVLQFSRQVDYEVVKLEVKNLPSTDPAGKRIHWINNFVVYGPAKRHLKKVRYTLFIPIPSIKNATFVYLDQDGLKPKKRPGSKGSQPQQPGFLQVDLDSADPGIGWK
jgi:hypothetical protein